MATELTGAPGLAGAPGLDVVIGLDLGTTSVKALALDAAGTVLARSAGGRDRISNWVTERAS